jgi:hypothetical protein
MQLNLETYVDWVNKTRISCHCLCKLSAEQYNMMFDRVCASLVIMLGASVTKSMLWVIGYLPSIATEDDLKAVWHNSTPESIRIGQFW